MKRLFAVLTALFLLASAPVTAQRKEGADASKRSVQGIVSDAGERPVEGAVVQVKDTKSLQIRSFVTKANGAYHFHGLSQDVDYELKAEHQGTASDSKTLSSFDTRPNSTINLKLAQKK